MGRLAEIEQRKLEIKELLESNAKDINLEELRSEIEALNAEKAQIEERKQIAEGITVGTIDAEKIEKPVEERKMSELFNVDTKEYRNAYLKNLMGKELNDVEKRSIAAANVVIPTDTYNTIFEKVTQMAPMLNEITLLNVAGNVTFAVEGVNNAAALHTENDLINGAQDTLVTVSLAGYEIVKLVRISATVKTMSISAFEGWLTKQLAENVAKVIENYIINGTGNSQPKGIEKAQEWSDGTNAVDYAGSKPTAAEISELISYLKGGYARNAKFLMNHKTFWQDIIVLRDDAKAPIVREDNGIYRIYGFPVIFSDYVADGNIYLGDYTKVVGNLAQNISVEANAASGFVYNAIDYRGVAIFDCDIAVGEAIVKGAAAL